MISMAEDNDPFPNDYEYASYREISKYNALNNMHALLMVKELKKLLVNSTYGNFIFQPEYHMEQHCAEYEIQEMNSNKRYEEYYRLMMTTQKKAYNESI